MSHTIIFPSLMQCFDIYAGYCRDTVTGLLKLRFNVIVTFVYLVSFQSRVYCEPSYNVSDDVAM